MVPSLARVKHSLPSRYGATERVAGWRMSSPVFWNVIEEGWRRIRGRKAAPENRLQTGLI
jgi:hypothetical protein